MYSNQRALRAAAVTVLETIGYRGVVAVKGSGGARLRCIRDGASINVMVRTSSDRWVGWMRDNAGGWKGLQATDLVVVAAANSQYNPSSADVFVFEPSVVRDAFDRNLASRLHHSPTLSRSAPIFVCLDPAKAGSPTSAGGDLKSKATWRGATTLPRSKGAPDPSAREDHQVDDHRVEDHRVEDHRPEDPSDGFAARVRKEFADLVGVSVDRVAVEFRVTL
jgi:hypothetical protein